MSLSDRVPSTYYLHLSPSSCRSPSNWRCSYRLNVVEHFVPLIRRRQQTQLLKRRQATLFADLLDNLAILQSEDCRTRKAHLLPSLRPVQLAHYEIIKSRTCVLAASNPASDNVIALCDKTISAIGFEEEVWKGLRMSACRLQDLTQRFDCRMSKVVLLLWNPSASSLLPVYPVLDRA